MIQKIKDALTVIRDSILILLFIILLLFPSGINSILIKAGFTKGNILGFDWEKQIQASRDSLTQANNKVEEVKNQLNYVIPQLESLQKNVATDSDKASVKKLSDSIRSSLMKINAAKYMLGRNVLLQDSLLRNVRRNN